MSHLVDYDSSSSSSSSSTSSSPRKKRRVPVKRAEQHELETPQQKAKQHNKKRRIRPPLPDDALTRRGTKRADQEVVPRDRTLPKTTTSSTTADGEWLCHVFVEMPSRPDLDSVITAVVEGCLLKATQQEPAQTGRTYGATSSEEVDGDQSSAFARPHISLTRPMLIRSHERAAFLRVVKDTVQSFDSGFEAIPHLSFSRLSVLRNDAATRDFVALEVGTGWEVLQSLSKSLSTALSTAFQAAPYYEEARFHSSLFWTSVSPHPKASQSDSSIAISPEAVTISASQHTQPLSPTSKASANLEAEKALDLPALERAHGPALRGCASFPLRRIGASVGTKVSWFEVRGH